jgi:type IV secretion system protein VirB6
MDMCPAASPGAGFIGSVSSYLDCQAQMLGSGGWAALAAPGSTLSVVLTGFLTLFVALAGYRLLLGGSLSVRSGTLAFVKIGAVLALATSWPAYRTLVYDVVVDGPAQLVGEIGPAAHVPGSDGTLLERLDIADRSLAQLAMFGPGPASAGEKAAPPPFSGFDEFALGGSRIVFLLTAIASITAVHIVGGLMLALGPFFIAFLLFDATRGLFEGWVRVLAGAALASFGVSISLGLELAILQPWLSELISIRAAGGAIPEVPSELLVLVGLFTIITIMVLKASIRAAHGFRLALVTRIVTPAAETAREPASVQAPAVTNPSTVQAEPGRAASIATAVAAMVRREAAAESRHSGQRRSRPSLVARSAGGPDPFVPAGRTFTHSAGRRGSARANRRDAAR